MKKIAAAIVAVLFVFFLSVAAKEKNRLPLPVTIMTAKTVFIDNQTGIAEVADRCFDELKKWGRFQVVEDRKQADIVLLLSSQRYSKSTDATESPSYTGYTYLTIIAPATGDNLWSSSREWGKGWSYAGVRFGTHSATRELIKDLRDRVEAQAKAH